MQIRVVVATGTGAGEGVQDATERTFSSGSRGFNINQKVTIDGKRYQISGNMVEIGSKPVA